MMTAATRWAGLLVSVRDPAEAAEAVAGGAAVVDVKEPARGPLGAADAGTAAAIAGVVAGRVPWTLACGELAPGGGAAAAAVAAAVAALGPGATPPAAAKAGPAGLSLAAWRAEFAAFAAGLPEETEPVAVAYADWDRADAPAPADLVTSAALAGCRMLLVDTFDKSAPGIVVLATAATLPEWIAAARAAGMIVAVAGRLATGDIAKVAGLGVDVVAVRGAACRGGRLGRVDRALVAAAVAEVRPPPA